MTKLLVLALALGFDSFRVSAGLGMIARDRRRDWQLALAFAVSDAGALLLGIALGCALTGWVGQCAATAGPLLIGALGLYIVCSAWHCKEAEGMGHWPLIGVPLVLSLDNLVTGAALGTLRFPTILCALTVGAASGFLSLLGLKLGGPLKALLRVRGQLAGGALLLAAAASLGLSFP